MSVGDGPKENESQRAKAMQEILSPIDARIKGLLQEPNFAKNARQSSVMQHLRVTLDMLGGVARSASVRTLLLSR